jgi:hypothetical protein
MRREPCDPSAELAAAVRAVNAAYLRIPEPYRPEAAIWTFLDCEVDAAFASGDQERALQAIEKWRAHHLRKFLWALLNAPLKEAA